MDPMESHPELESELERLRKQHQSLKSYFSLLLAALLVVSGTLNFLLLWQVISVHRSLKANQPSIEKFLEEYRTVHLPMLNSFMTRLQEFAKKDPGFLPVLAKYNLTESSTNVQETVSP